MYFLKRKSKLAFSSYAGFPEHFVPGIYNQPRKTFAQEAATFNRAQIQIQSFKIFFQKNRAQQKKEKY